MFFHEIDISRSQVLNVLSKFTFLMHCNIRTCYPEDTLEIHTKCPSRLTPTIPESLNNVHVKLNSCFIGLLLKMKSVQL